LPPTLLAATTAVRLTMPAVIFAPFDDAER
jgi:hypothetical protein